MRREWRQGRRQLALVVVAAALAAGTPAVAADPPDGIEYDIVRYQDSLAVWVNLARHLDEPEFRALREGVDYAFEVALDLMHPRRLWGAERVAETSRLVRISYQLVAETFTVQTDSGGMERRFLSREGLASFLADSILLAVAPLEGLRDNRHYRLGARVVRISLTGINLAADGGSDGGSPVKALFRGFLKLTNYGRDDWSTTSRSFSLKEVLPLR